MNPIFIAVIYGLVQGLSEFLPISSSAHLALMPFFLELRDPGVAFDLCLHIGTALAVLIYFRQSVLAIGRQAVPSLVRWSDESAGLCRARHFVLATLASVLLILALRPFTAPFRGPWMIAGQQLVFGLLLWAADLWQRRPGKALHGFGHFSTAGALPDAVIIGLAQALAIFPGVSRSGITLTAALFRGIERREAAAFSFLLSLPIIIAGALVELPALLRSGLGEDGLFILGLGVAVSFVSGILTIHFFMRLIGRINLGWFTLYRVGLAGLLVFLLLRS